MNTFMQGMTLEILQWFSTLGLCKVICESIFLGTNYHYAWSQTKCVMRVTTSLAWKPYVKILSHNNSTTFVLTPSQWHFKELFSQISSLIYKQQFGISSITLCSNMWYLAPYALMTMLARHRCRSLIGKGHNSLSLCKIIWCDTFYLY